MKFVQKNSRCTVLDQKRNEEILEDLKAEAVDEKLRRYNSDWLRRVARMYSCGTARIMLNCRPVGRRRLERPLKRLLGEVETGLSEPNC
jgi:hypothetical protein